MSDRPLTQQPSNNARRWRAVWLSVVVAALGYLVFSVWSGWEETWRAVRLVGVGGLALVLGLSLVNYGLRFWRWQYYLRLLGYRVPTKPHLSIYLSGFALTTTPGKAGEVLRSPHLVKHGVPYRASVATLVAERIVDLLAVLLLALPGLWAYPPARPILIGLLIAGGVGLLLLSRRAWADATVAWAQRWLPERIGDKLYGALETLANVRHCFSVSVLTTGLVVGIVAWAAEALAFYLVLVWIGVSVPVLTAFFIYSFAMVIGAISFLPGGLGSAEATMVALLLLQGASEPTAAAATVVIRVCTLWFAVLIGAVVLGRLSTKTPDHKPDHKSDVSA